MDGLILDCVFLISQDLDMWYFEICGILMKKHFPISPSILTSIPLAMAIYCSYHDVPLLFVF